MMPHEADPEGQKPNGWTRLGWDPLSKSYLPLHSHPPQLRDIVTHVLVLYWRDFASWSTARRISELTPLKIYSVDWRAGTRRDAVFGPSLIFCMLGIDKAWSPHTTGESVVVYGVYVRDAALTLGSAG